MRAEYHEAPCRTALNRVSNMAFKWSLNPYMGCVHRCTFCYVRGFERRADRPADDRYGRTIRVKVNVAEVLRRELARPSWKRELVAIGAATDPYQPAEGRYRLTRGCLEALATARTPLSLVTRGPMVVRDIDVLADAARRAEVDVNISIPTLAADVWRRTEPGTAPPRQRLRAVTMLVGAGIRTAVGLAPIRGCRIDPRSSPRWSAPPATSAQRASGAISSISSRGRASISSRIWHATGRSNSRVTKRSIGGRSSTGRSRSRSKRG
jgi:DNA repair photolyase